MKFVSIRLVTHINYADLGDGLPATPQHYSFIEFMSSGWERGSRTRIKRCSGSAAYQYLNKLLDGRWISDTQYDAAWSVLLSLVPWGAEYTKKKGDSPSDSWDVAFSWLYEGGPLDD